MPGSLVSCSLYDVTLLSLCTRRRFSLPSFDCVSVLSAFLHDVLKTDAARITDLDIQMLHYESWKSIYFGSKVKVTSHATSSGVGLCTLVNAGLFWLEHASS